ncbi:MAG: ADP-glyceromanno-heptose 6-epimerase [Flavobacterium stagni]
MIVITGAAGFIGSALIGELLFRGYGDIIAVDDFGFPEKQKNLVGKSIRAFVHRDEFRTWLEKNQRDVQFVFHIGARTNTAESDWNVLNRLNVDYTESLFDQCTQYSIPLIYASSAATYGNGKQGFQDGFSSIEQLQPLNPYGSSKQLVDLWVKEKYLSQNHSLPPFWAGFKFFNVFGPNEYHKGRMASVVFHAFHQIKGEASMRLFKSYREGIEHGWQQRDFIWVKDVLDVLIYFMEHRKNCGLYNLGTGHARTFLDLGNAVFSSMKLEPSIQFIDMPEDIRENYQYFTQAEMGAVKNAGYIRPFTSLENAVNQYVNEYLIPQQYI